MKIFNHGCVNVIWYRGSISEMFHNIAHYFSVTNSTIWKLLCILKDNLGVLSYCETGSKIL